MRSTNAAFVLSALFLMLGVGQSLAQGLPEPELSINVSFEDANIVEATVFADPAGLSGFGLDNCYENGSLVDATLKVQLMLGGVPVPGFDRSRIKLVIMDMIFGDPGSDIPRECTGTGNIADVNTDANGWTTISAPRFFAYGTLQDSPYNRRYAVYVDESGFGAWRLCFWGDDILVKTPDFNGDGTVNVSDVAPMAVYYYNGTYDTQLDFNGDGLENVTDLQMFSGSLGTSCSMSKAAGSSLTVEELLAMMQDLEEIEPSSWGALKTIYQ